MLYNFGYSVMQYCNGGYWASMGGTAGSMGVSGDITTGLVGYWKLDDGSGTKATDSSGNGNTGTTQHSPTWTTSGKVNGALTLNGTNQYVNVADAASLDIAGSWTVVTWVNPSALPSSGNISLLASKEASVGTNYDLVIDNGHFNAGLGWAVDFNSSGCCDDHFAKYVTSISTGTWYHVVGVYDSVGQTVTVYLNGISVASSSVAGSPPESSAGNNLAIGAIGSGSGFFTAGTIDEVRIYNRALSASDVLMLYDATATACAGPVGYAGDLIYNAGTNHVPQFCNGTNWIRMGRVPGAGGGGCSGPTASEGTFIFNADKGVMQYCDGTNWMATGNLPVAPTGQIVWLKFDDGSGTSASDSSGNGNTGTLNNGPVWTAGEFGGALSFDGVDDYVSVPSFASDSSAVTYAYWAYFPSAVTQATYARTFQTAPFNLDPGGNPGGDSHEVNPNGDGSNRIKFVHWTSTPSDIGEITVNVGAWNHIVEVANGDSATVYLNGIPVVSGSGSRTIVNAPVAIGDGGGKNFNGKIDDFRIYNRALSASNVYDLYAATGGKASVQIGPVDRWKFDDGSGTTASDSGIYGNPGTLNNGPTWIAGELGGALSFNGTNQYVGIPLATAANGVQTTYAYWAYFPSGVTQTQWARTFQTGTNSANPAAGISHEVNPGGTGSNTIQFVNWAAGGGNATIGSTTVTLNTWNHFVEVVDGNNATIYLNGVQILSGSASRGGNR